MLISLHFSMPKAASEIPGRKSKGIPLTEYVNTPFLFFSSLCQDRPLGPAEDDRVERKSVASQAFQTLDGDRESCLLLTLEAIITHVVLTIALWVRRPLSFTERGYSETLIKLHVLIMTYIYTQNHKNADVTTSPLPLNVIHK